jgi:hypothetical protein
MRFFANYRFVSRVIGSAPGNTGLQTPELKRWLEFLVLACFATALSNLRWRRRVEPSVLMQRLLVEKCVLPPLHPVEVPENIRSALPAEQLAKGL